MEKIIGGGMMINQFIYDLLLIVIPSSFTWLTYNIKKLYKHVEYESQGVKLILKDIMHDKYLKYIHDGKIEADELAEFEELYYVYHNLHGNGEATIWIDDLRKMERE